MIDTTASATPMPPQPVATETNPEALPLPPDPLPNAVAPSVTDPVSNLDFLPVDDAFALEIRSETIEQLVGGDALRRGVSERIEAGRSHTNADRVAGRDRVRVHGSLHEHTGHGLAEVAAHLHTTVDGTLDVHAGNEDTVLLAGHMRDLWDGGTATVAAMTDDTAAGGGIRVTTPLDLWVHGLMGVEERIGTCTADAVLMESSATHYEREYGPGVHAAGLAVYTGSLYQSSRSTFRPLMRVSSGVRNLIAGGDGAGPPPAHTPIQSDWAPTYRQVRGLGCRFRAIRLDRAHLDFNAAADCMAQAVLYRFRKFGGNPKHLLPLAIGGTKPEQAYRAIEDMARRAAESGNAAQAEVFRQALEHVNRILSVELSGLTTKYGALDALSTRAMQDMPTTQAVQLPPARVGPATSVALPVTVLPSVTGGAARVPFGSLDPGSVGHLTQVPGVPGLPPASGLPGPRLCEAAGAEAGDLGRWWLDPPGTASGATAAEQAAIETPVAPSLGGTSSFWLQPLEPVPAPGSVRFDIGVHQAGETVQPPPVTTTASSTAPALSPGAAFPTQSWRDDNFDVERALLANELPREFDSSLLVAKARMFKELGIADFGIAGDLAAGRLPLQTIDVLIDGYRATDEGGSSTLVIEYLSSLKESIERALRDEYPERTDPQWLNLVRELLRESGEPAPLSAASTAGQAEFDVMKEIDRLLGTGEGASHPRAAPRPLRLRGAPGPAPRRLPPPPIRRAFDRRG